MDIAGRPKLRSRIRKYEVILVILLAAIPWLWYKPGFSIARGDNFPYLFSEKNIGNDFYLWSIDNLGNPTPVPAYAFYGLLWAILEIMGTGIGTIQMVILSAQFGLAAFSMIYLSKALYPDQPWAGVFAGTFYVLNLFVMSNLLNAGLIWTYAFLPLLLALLVRAIVHSENVFRHSVFFAIAFTLASSFASMNPANNALIIISLATVVIFCVIVERKTALKRLGGRIAILSIVTLLLNLWWIIPVLNYYIPSSSTQLLSEVSVSTWSWTHVRASFLNIFWLNGAWGWRPEYYSFYNLYSNNGILLALLFAPFFISVSSLLFKDGKRRQNAYFMLVILAFIFLAKGLHEPLSSVNLLLYSYVPFMNMFREPATKFTMAMIPFLALLIGYSMSKVTNSSAWDRIKHGRLGSKVVAGSIILVLMVSALPIFTNPIENITPQIPYSTYVKVPQYWQEANQLLSNMQGDFRILLTPMDDYYQIPYTWGYYGSDSFAERYFQKPVIGTSVFSSYVINPRVVALANQLRDAMKFNRTQDFETILGLFNVKYILQRNDLDYNYMASTDRDMLGLNETRNFLLAQPNIRLLRTVGQIDIYENTKVESYVNCFEYGDAIEYNVGIENVMVSSNKWDFNSDGQLDDWKNATPSHQFGSTCRLSSDNSTLKFEIWNSTWGWKTIDSPVIPVQYNTKYDTTLDIKAQNAHDVHIKINEYDKSFAMIHSEYVAYVGDKSFDWKTVQLSYTPRNASIGYLGLAIWSGSETPEPLPNTIWIDNIEIKGYVTKMNSGEIQKAFQQSIEDPAATIVEYQKVDQTDTVVKLKATRPFNLVLSEAYNPNWKAYSEGVKYDSIPIYSAINGFMINRTGEFEVYLRYEPQQWFYAGCLVSTTTLMLCILLVICQSRKHIAQSILKRFHR